MSPRDPPDPGYPDDRFPSEEPERAKEPWWHFHAGVLASVIGAAILSLVDLDFQDARTLTTLSMAGGLIGWFAYRWRMFRLGLLLAAVPPALIWLAIAYMVSRIG